MSADKECEKRWMEYLLGEADPAEREEIKDEMHRSPEEAEQVRCLVEGLSDWAREPVPGTALELDLVRIKSISPVRKSRSPRWLWGIAAAAILIFALSQVQFSISFGNTVFNWGPTNQQKNVQNLMEKMNIVSAQLNEIKETSRDNSDQIKSLSATTGLIESQLRDSVARLVQNQQIETRTRYRDIQNLIQLTGYGNMRAQQMPNKEETSENTNRY